MMESFECCQRSEWESVGGKKCKVSLSTHGTLLSLAARFCACYHDLSLMDRDNSSKINFIPR